MKTSIFDMNFTLPPLIEMTEVEKDMAEKDMAASIGPVAWVSYWPCFNC